MPTRPIPILPRYFDREDARQPFVNRLFDSGARSYDRVCSIMSLGSGRWYRRQALVRAGLGTGMRVLDVAVGTGLVSRTALEIVGSQGRGVGLDPSAGMLHQCRGIPALRLVRGRGEMLPVGDRQFDFVTLGYALRHLADLERTFAGFRRVLRPGGRVLVLEITPPESGVSRALTRFYFRRVVPLVTRVVAREESAVLLWRYFWDTMEACVPPETILTALERAGFAAPARHVELGLFSEYTGMRGD